MKVSQGIGLTKDRRRSRGAVTLALSALALASGAGPASAHNGDTSMIHSCIVPSSGYVQLIGADDSCPKNARAQDWPAVDTNTTYSAGSGLQLLNNEFSVTGAPWGGLTGVPAGFADGVDNVGSTAWSALTGVPDDFADGDDDDGGAVLTTFKQALAADDGTPNQPEADLVSFSKIKHLTAADGTGRILGEYIQNGTIKSTDLGDGEIASADLAGTYAQLGTGFAETVPGAVTSEKIKDGTIEGRDLGGVVTTATKNVDPPEIQPGTRAAVTIPVPGLRTNDLAVVSPPGGLEQGVLFAGSDVLPPGDVMVVYLHNLTAAAVDPAEHVWKVRWLDTSG